MRFYFTEQLSDKKFKTPEGFLICQDCIIARVGTQLYTKDEMPYEPDGNGFIHVERPAEEVFKPESIASFAGKPFVIHHPTVDGEIVDVTPENWRDLAHGTVLSPRRGAGIHDDVLMADILVTDQAAIDLVLKNPNNELSCGYDADYVPVGPGKARQVNIIGNHVAWVESGRCGPKCRIYDSRENLLKENNMAEVATKKFGWLDELFGRAHKARDVAELNAIKDEAIQKVEEEGGTSDGDHTHIHLHPHPSGDTVMPTPAPTEQKPLVAAAAEPTMPSGDNEARLSKLEAGHQKIEATLEQICQALGIGENGEDEEGGEGGFGDEANLLRNEPRYNHPPDKGIYEGGDYSEGAYIEMDTERPFQKPKPITKGFGAEAPPGSSAAMYTGDRSRRRPTGDAGVRLQAAWQQMIADADVIIPGIRIPTVDSKTHPVNVINTMCGFRRRVLDRVSQDLNQSVDLENITGGTPLRRMTCDSVSTVFRSLAAVYRDRNNRGVLEMGTVGMMPGVSPANGIKSITDFQKKINDMAESTWGTGGATR